MSRLRRFCVLSIGLTPILVSELTGADPNDWKSRGEKIVRLVRERFHDAKIAEEWAQRHAGYGESIFDAGQFTERTRAILSELRASHTAYYTDRDVQYYGLLSIWAKFSNKPPIEYASIGIDVTHDGFVRTVFVGGPGDFAGIRRGDKILKADGKAFEPIESFRGRIGQLVELAVQRKADEEPIPISVRPLRVDARTEWLDAQSRGTRIMYQGGKAIAYVPMFSCAGGEFQEALQQTILDKQAKADALIVDFRNGWGGCDPSFLNLFTRTPPMLTMTGRDGQRLGRMSQWRKPLFVLINGGSKSGKEAVAYSIQKHKLGTLIGERTGGAVLGGRIFPLSDDSLLYLAVADVEVDGERLEGRGVTPDVEVPDVLRFANGADPQLEKALEQAAK